MKKGTFFHHRRQNQTKKYQTHLGKDNTQASYHTAFKLIGGGGASKNNKYVQICK